MEALSKEQPTGRVEEYWPKLDIVRLFQQFSSLMNQILKFVLWQVSSKVELRRDADGICFIEPFDKYKTKDWETFFGIRKKTKELPSSEVFFYCSLFQLLT